MLGVLVELNGLNQIEKWDPHLGDEELKQLLKELNLNSDQSFRTGSCFYFQMPFFKDQASVIWNTIERCFSYILSRREEYQGVLMTVDRASKLTLEEGYKRVRDLRLPFKQLDALYLSPQGAESFPGLQGTSKEGDFFILSGEALNGFDIESDVQKFASREKLYDGILQKIIPSIDDEEDDYLFHFYGSESTGILESIISSIKMVIKGGLGIPVPVFDGKSSELGNTALMTPLYDISPEVVEFLSPMETQIWNNRQKIQRGICSNPNKRDCLLLVQTFLNGYIRLCREKSFPPYVIIRYPEQLSEKELNIFYNVISQGKDHGARFIIITAENLLPKSWQNFQTRRMRIPPLSYGEVEAKLKEAGLNEYSCEDALEKTNGNIISLQHLILLKKNHTELDPGRDGDISRNLLHSLGRSYQKIVYIIGLYPNLLSQEQWEDILIPSNVIQDGVTEVFEDLAKIQIINNESLLRLNNPSILDGLGLSEVELSSIRQILFKAWTTLNLSDLDKKVRILLIASEKDELTEDLYKSFLDGICRLLEAGRSEIVKNYLERFENVAVEDSLAMAMARTLFLRTTLARADREMARIRFLTFQEVVDNPLTFSETLYNLEAGRYHYACGEYRLALDEVKKALLYIQNRNQQPYFEADSNFQLGLIMMGLRRLDESALYFNLTTEIISEKEYPHEFIKVTTYQSICHFLIGNHAKALRICEDAQLRASHYGRREWELLAQFIKGRILFDLGNYKDAEKAFVDGLQLCELFFDEGRKQTFYAWLVRSRIYQYRFDSVLAILGDLKPTGEVLLFTAEALYFLNRPQKALEALGLALEAHDCRITEFAPGECLTWTNGFSNIEDRAIKGADGNGVLGHNIRAFRGYLLGREGRIEEGRQELSRLIREEKICEEDPYNHFYYYLYNQIVPDHGDAESVNRLTILSRGLKYLQLRGSRIDETKVKQSYLNNNYWNSRLMDEGRSNKII